jgi:hypothetical protein
VHPVVRLTLRGAPGGRERQNLHAPVGRVGAALDEAACLESVGEPRHVRQVSSARSAFLATHAL